MAETKRLDLLFECHGIEKSYSDKKVLCGIDASLRKGKTLAVMGRSGCGKSTFLKCISLLESPDAGDASIDNQLYLKSGQNLFVPWQIRSKIALVFQEYNLFPNMTVLRNITLALQKAKGLNPKEAEERAISMAERLHIDETLNRYPETLSGGQAQRVALARALVLQPDVLLLDEITAALDPESVASVIDAIRDIRSINSTGGIGIIIVTHLLAFAIEFADNIAFLHEGVLVDNWPANQYIENCKHPESRAFNSRFAKFPLRSNDIKN